MVDFPKLPQFATGWKPIRLIDVDSFSDDADFVGDGNLPLAADTEDLSHKHPSGNFQQCKGILMGSILLTLDGLRTAQTGTFDVELIEVIQSRTSSNRFAIVNDDMKNVAIGKEPAIYSNLRGPTKFAFRVEQIVAVPSDRLLLLFWREI